MCFHRISIGGERNKFGSFGSSMNFYSFICFRLKFSRNNKSKMNVEMGGLNVSGVRLTIHYENKPMRDFKSCKN